MGTKSRWNCDRRRASKIAILPTRLAEIKIAARLVAHHPGIIESINSAKPPHWAAICFPFQHRLDFITQHHPLLITGYGVLLTLSPEGDIVLSPDLDFPIPILISLSIFDFLFPLILQTHLLAFVLSIDAPSVASWTASRRFRRQLGTHNQCILRTGPLPSFSSS